MASKPGLPVLGTDAAGEDTYATVVTAPKWTSRYMHVSVSTKAAVISLDGGTTDHFVIPADTERLFEGLAIPPGSLIKAKNLTAGQNYANLYIAVWGGP